MADERKSIRNGKKPGRNGRKYRRNGKKSRKNDVEGGQELLPGLPDEVTVHHIASKMTWEMRNVMEMVSREWQHVFRSRRVYDARVLSQSMEPYLVLISRHKFPDEPVLILYSCTNGTSLQIPPVPVSNDEICIPLAWDEYICLDGRLYRWVGRQRASVGEFLGWTEVWALDLVGVRQWTKCGRLGRSSQDVTDYINGELDGKLYSFRGSTLPDGVGVLEARGTDCPSLLTEHDIQKYVNYLPKAEIYDPQSDSWSFITPQPVPCFNATNAEYERYLATFDEWEKWKKEQLRTVPSTVVGRYEPFYSEWKQRLSTTSASNDYCRRNAMAPQVYQRRYLYRRQSKLIENLFFIQEKLVKLVMRTHSKHKRRSLDLDLQAYNTQKDAWEHLRSFPALHVCNNDGIWNCAFVDNFIWSVIDIRPRNRGDAKVALVRSPPVFGAEADGNSAAWTHFPFPVYCFQASLSQLRPIHL